GSCADVVPKNQTNATVSGMCTLARDNALQLAVRVINPSGKLIAAHLHLGAADENGPVVFTFPPQSTLIEDGGKKLNISGTWKPTFNQLTDCKFGKLYFDVHTESHPEGDARARVPIH